MNALCIVCVRLILLCNPQRTVWPGQWAPRLILPPAAAPDWLPGFWCLFLFSAAARPQSHCPRPSMSRYWQTSCSGHEPAEGKDIGLNTLPLKTTTTTRLNRTKQTRDDMDLELQYDLQLLEAVAGCSARIFASLLRRPL